MCIKDTPVWNLLFSHNSLVFNFCCVKLVTHNLVNSFDNWLYASALVFTQQFVYVQDGGTPLFVACQCNHLDVVKELLDRGADIHAQMVDGATPLFITAQNGHNHLLSFLIKQGAEIDLKRKVHVYFAYSLK